jgi:RNA recognition motif-containing protein
MYTTQTEAERENKVFIGMLPKILDEKDLYDIFRSFGELKEVFT